MLERLGFKLFAYDYRAEQIPTFDAEMDALKRHGVTLLAWWFPTTMNDEARLILNVLKRHKLKAQLWVMGAGTPTKTPEEQKLRVQAEAKRIRPIAEEAAKIGCTVALYNHENWFGEPENQIQIIERDLVAWMEEHEYQSVTQLKGSLSQKNCPDPAANKSVSARCPTASAALQP